MIHRSHRPTAAIHRGTLLALLFGLAAPGCDDVDETLLDESGASSAGETGETPVDADDAPVGRAIGDEFEPQAAGDYPRFEIEPPIRVDDLKPNHYALLRQDANTWDDLVIARYADGWSEFRPGTSSGEPNQLAWGTPVYAGVDGEVMNCWRSAPYNPIFTDVDHMLAIGGNFMTIKTSDGKWVYYAHLDTDTIPADLCPNVSTNANDPGYLNPCPAGTPNNCKVCAGDGCARTETYIPAGNRPQVHAGQFIGRMGAIGQAGGAHLHMGAGTVTTTNGIDRVFPTLHITFKSTFQAPRAGATLPIPWTASSGSSIPDGVTSGDLLLWPGGKREETYSGSYRLSSLGGAPGPDLLCHSTASGNLYTDVNDPPVTFSGTDWSRTANFCKNDLQRLHTGDFDGDGISDILCHDRGTGVIQVDHGTPTPPDGEVEFNGVNFTAASGWCHGATQQLVVGEFDGDSKDDLLCHDHADGRRWIDRGNDGIDGTDHTYLSPWCHGHYQRLHVGRFDGATTGDDLLCHDTLTGQLYFDVTPSNFQIAAGAAIFGATDKTAPAWCNGGGQRLFVGDFLNSPYYDALACHDSDTGKTFLNAAGTGNYPGTSYTGTNSGFCTAPHERLKVGDVDGNNADDLVCFDQVTGELAVDYAWFGALAGADWSSSAGWCTDSAQGLH